MWILIWFLFSSFVLGVFAWSVRILLKQKMAWKAYAEKAGLAYNTQKGFLVSPYLTGEMGNCGFGLFSEPQPTSDSRGQRYTTVLEFVLHQGLGTKGLIGTPKMTGFLENLDVHKSVNISDKEWDPTWIIRTDNPVMVGKYLTAARIDTLKKIFKAKSLGAMLIFDEFDAVLRIETSDPLANTDRLEKVVKGVLAQIPVLMPNDEEKALFAAQAEKK